MPKTLAWLANYVIWEQLGKSASVHGRPGERPSLVPSLLQACSIQHWFGAKEAGNEQQLLASLEKADPSDSLPAILQCDCPWNCADRNKAAAAMPGCAPLLYFLLEALGDRGKVASEGMQHKNDDEGQPVHPTAATLPNCSTTLLRGAVLAAKLLSLIPCQSSPSTQMEDLVCECLLDLTLRLSICLEAMHRLRPVPSDDCQQLGVLLAKVLLPTLREGSRPRASKFQQYRALAACGILTCILRHGGQSFAAAVSDMLAACGRFPGNRLLCAVSRYAGPLGY